MDEDRDCSMCRWYSNLEGWCSRYREFHYPSDGEGCPGWEFWKDTEDEDRPYLTGEDGHVVE